MMKNTIGTLPEAGIDIEPDVADEILQDIIIRNSQFINNNGNGIMLALFYLDDTSEDISIAIEDCYFENNFTLSNVYAYAEIACLDNNFNGVDGVVSFNRCYVASSQFSPVYISKTVESYDLNFNDCVFKNVSQNSIGFNNPIFFEVTSYEENAPRTGGVDFSNCRIDFDADIPFLTYFENLGTVDGLGNVSGNFFISNETMPSFETGTNPENVNITFENITGEVSRGVEIEFLEGFYVEDGGEPMIYSLSRANDESYPLAVDISYSGTGGYGMDYAIHPPFSIIPGNENSMNIGIDIIVDDVMEDDETVLVHLEESACYSFGDSQQAQTLIVENETLSTSLDEESSGLKIYPNPSRDYLVIDSDQKIRRLEFYQLEGSLVRTIASPTSVVDIGDLNRGVYLLRIFGDRRVVSTKLIVY